MQLEQASYRQFTYRKGDALPWTLCLFLTRQPGCIYPRVFTALPN